VHVAQLLKIARSMLYAALGMAQNEKPTAALTYFYRIWASKKYREESNCLQREPRFVALDRTFTSMRQLRR
jgi:hypothetical protein